MTFSDITMHKNIASAAFLALATLFVVYRWHYSAQSDAAASLQTLANVLRVESGAVPVPPPAGGTKGATIPELLSSLQEAATQNGVTILSVATDASDPAKIRLGMQGDFRNTMLFLGRMETFQVAIAGFDFAPDDSGSLASSIDIQHSVKPGAPTAFADYLDAILKYTAVRNPFEIGDPIPLPNAGSDLGDLSWTYHLSSITLYGAVRVATIDGKDYRVGEMFSGMQITSIGPSSVSLKAPNQPLVQKLHFRRNPTGRAG